MRRLQTGDEEAFAALVRQYQTRLLRMAESVVTSRAVAEEVVQDTWLAVVRGVDRFEGRSSFKTWLFHILLNRARTRRPRTPHRITARGWGGRPLRRHGRLGDTTGHQRVLLHRARAHRISFGALAGSGPTGSACSEEDA